MPLWYETALTQKYSPQQRSAVKQVLILVSGVGTPRNWTHSKTGNSTKQCASLMKQFLQTLYPNLVVVQIHSDANRDIFRYDENIAFVQQELLPKIQDYRDAHAKGLPYPDEDEANHPSMMYNPDNDDRPFSTEWRKSFSVTLSFADGSPGTFDHMHAPLFDSFINSLIKLTHSFLPLQHGHMPSKQR
jgi:hypothetical protein